MARKILITGGAGNIGRKLQGHFAALGDEVVRLDHEDRGEPGIQVADLTQWDDAWVASFKDADCIFHLAGDPNPAASWASIQALNIDLTLNVYEAAVRQGAKRLVFASSNWVMAGHRFGDGPLTTDQEPYPVNAYGVSKLIGERLGKSYSERWGLSVLCFRIGYNQHDHDNRPGPQMNMNSWGQLMWLSDRDLCAGFEAAADAPDSVRFAVVNMMSANPGMRWDLSETREVLSFQPKDGAAPVVTEEMRAQEELARKARGLIEATEACFAGQHW